MAEEIKKIISIDTSQAEKALKDLSNGVDTAGQSFNSMKEYKQYIDKLTASLLDLDKESEEYAKTCKDIQTAQDKMNEVMYDTKKETDAAEGSYNALNKQLNELKKTWKATTDQTERAELGKKMLEVNNQLKDLDASVGNFQRNAGNYESAFAGIGDQFEALGGPMASLKQGVAGVGQAFKALIANPVGAVIAAIVVSVKALVDAFKRNEEATNKLKSAFSAFAPIVDGIKIAIDKVVTTIADFASNAIPKLVSGVVSAGSTVAGWLNKIGIISDEKFAQIKENIDSTAEAIKNGTTDAQKAAKIEEDLAKKRRELSVNEAKYKRDIEALNTKIADEEKYTAEERSKFAKEAEAIAQKMYEDQKAIAELELQVANQRIASGDKSTEALDAQAEAQKRLYELEEEYYGRQGTLVSQRVQANRDAADAAEEAAEEETKAKEKAAEEAKKIQDEELKKVKEIQDEIFYAKMSNGDKTKAELTKKYQEELALLVKYGQDTTALTEQYKSNIAGADYATGNEKLDENDSEFAFQQEIADKTIQIEYEKNQRLLELDRERLENRKAILEEMLNIENLSAEQKQELNNKILETEVAIDENSRQMSENEKQRASDMINTYSSLASSIGSLVGQITDYWQESIDKRVENGEITEEQAEKEFEQSKALQISTTILTGLAGIAAAIASPVANAMGPAGWIAAGVQSALIATTTAIQVAKIAQTKFQKSSSAPSGGGVSGSSASVTPAATKYNPNYTTSVTGNSYEDNLKNAVSEGTKAGTQNMRVYVVESDIREAGIKAEVRDSEATF